jgi:hypothetical protein
MAVTTLTVLALYRWCDLLPDQPPEGPGSWWLGCLTVVLLILAVLAVWAVVRWLL